MTKKSGRDWKEGSRAVPGSGKAGYLGKLRLVEVSEDGVEIYEPEAYEEEEQTILRRMRKYVERKGKQ